MRTVLLASLLAITTLPATGCLGCGGFTGAGDKVYARNTEMMILCENGGFVVNLSASTLEGKFMQTADSSFGINGPDGQLAFDFVSNTDGTATTPQLGDGTWTPVDMDQVALDHANVQCTDLTTRPWWSSL